MTKTKDKSMNVKVKSVIRHFSLLILFITMTAPAMTAPAHSDVNAAIGALGTLLPESGILHLSGAPGTVISSIEVKPEDRVLKGTVLAHLSNKELFQAELRAIQNEYEILLSKHTHTEQILKLVRDNNSVRLKRADTSLNKYLNLSANAQITTLREQKQNTLSDARYALKVSEAKIAQELASFALNKKKLELQIESSQILGNEKPGAVRCRPSPCQLRPHADQTPRSHRMGREAPIGIFVVLNHIFSTRCARIVNCSDGNSKPRTSNS